MGQLSPRLPRGNISHRESQTPLPAPGARTLSSNTSGTLAFLLSLYLTLGLQVSHNLKCGLCRSTQHRQEQVLYKIPRLPGKLSSAQLLQLGPAPLCPSVWLMGCRSLIPADSPLSLAQTWVSQTCSQGNWCNIPKSEGQEKRGQHQPLERHN